MPRVKSTIIELHCEKCQKPFGLISWRVNAGEGRFCSRECANTRRYVLADTPDVTSRFWARVIKAGPDECWSWCGATANFGYGMFSVKFSGKKKSFMAHRVSWEIHFGPIPDGMSVLHKCDNPTCSNPLHLFIGTQADNMEDMISKGRSRAGTNPSKGKGHWNARLSEDDVMNIRQMYVDGIMSIEIGKKYNLSKTSVFKIIHSIKWKHLPPYSAIIKSDTIPIL